MCCVLSYGLGQPSINSLKTVITREAAQTQRESPGELIEKNSDRSRNSPRSAVIRFTRRGEEFNYRSITR